MHWVAAADAVPAEIRLYSHLFNRPDPGAEATRWMTSTPTSLEILTGALVEPALADGPVGEAVQFERTGYFALDPRLQARAAGVQSDGRAAGYVGEGAGENLAGAVVLRDVNNSGHEWRLPGGAHRIDAFSRRKLSENDACQTESTGASRG